MILIVLTIECTGLQECRALSGLLLRLLLFTLYVFCGERLLVSYLRESNIDSAKHGWAILALLVKALRKRWPKVKITLRADSALSLENAALVRASGSQLHRRTGQERALACTLGQVAETGRAQVPKERRKSAALHSI